MFQKIGRRQNNIEVFNDTIENINSNEMLQESLQKSIKSQKLYLENDVIEFEEGTKRDGRVVVSKKRSLEAASKYAKNKKVCVLNFASATNPGGGVENGSSAQEEALCRCSTLYPCLRENELWSGFYLPHRGANNPLYNDDIIYTPGVTVFKSDVESPKKMLQMNWYDVDILTAAAPNLRHMPSNYMNPFAGNQAANISDEELLVLHQKRIERIFKVAIRNGAEVLILGAFGCGAFRNPPGVVAKAFFKMQERYRENFDTIEYAVFCTPKETENYEVFRAVLES